MTARRTQALLLVAAAIYGLSFATTWFFYRNESDTSYMQQVSKPARVVEREAIPQKCPNDAIKCRYEGHCPVDTTCVMKLECDYGVCEPYYTKEESNDSACLEPCLAELQWDERLYYHATIDVVSKTKTSSSKGRPNGCVIRYQRNHHAYKETDEAIREEWLKETARHVIQRVDPVRNTNRTIWQAMCFDPCQSNADCAPPAQKLVNRTAFVCVEGACQRNRDWENSYWIPPHQEYKDLIIVSGANKGYFRGLENLAASVRYWAPKNRMVVYNLGMSSEQLASVQSWKNVIDIKWKDGIPKSYPPHVRVPKKYAWKSLAINESLAEYKEIFWLDAGTTLAGPLDPAERILEQTGLFLVKGQDVHMKGTSHPDTYKWFGVDKETFMAGPHNSGGTQAHLWPSRYVDTIVKPNAECALKAECVAPFGSNLGNHRYDQTSLSILSYKAQAPHHTEYVAAQRNQLNIYLDKPSFKFIYTARQLCRHYSKKGY